MNGTRTSPHSIGRRFFETMTWKRWPMVGRAVQLGCAECHVVRLAEMLHEVLVELRDQPLAKEEILGSPPGLQVKLTT